MKLYYIENLRIPTEKAHGVQIMKMSEALADLGVDLTLILPRKYTTIREDPFDYYQVKKNFKIQWVSSINLIYFEKVLGSFGFWLENIIYAKLALIWVLFQKKPDIIYTRQITIAFVFSIFFKNVYFEAHVFKNNTFYKWLLKPVSGIIVITRRLKELHQDILPNKKILVAYDGVDFEQFNLNINQQEARQYLNLPQNRKIVLYTGHLYKWKGAVVLLEAARNFQFSISNFHNVLFVFVGGTKKDIEGFKQEVEDLNNVIVIGHRPHSEIPYWLKAADLLILPNSGKFEISQSYTSPLKLFEYMASSRPIIASDLPSLKEVLDENCCLFFQPDEPWDLAEKIITLINDEKLKNDLSRQGFDKVQSYTWENRAKLILDFMKLK